MHSPHLILPLDFALFLELALFLLDLNFFSSFFSSFFLSFLSFALCVAVNTNVGLGAKLGDKPYERNGELELQLTYEHPETVKSWAWLIKMDSGRFAPRKRGKHGKVHTPVATPQLVTEALNKAGHRIKHYTAVPPVVPSTATIFPKVQCMHQPAYVAGRYNKYSRNLSQTPWLIEGVRRSEFSVEELLTDAVMKEFRADSIKFSASGREDVDVRMLGDGRPFAIELINPRKASVSADVLRAIQDGINGKTGEDADLVGCRDLQMVDKGDMLQLKEGEETKSKTYCCVVWTEKDLTAEELDAACSQKNVKLAQATPVRVAHRRTMMVREKTVQWMAYKKLKPHYIKLWLGTQAGTYIKEFVHGDFGRTVPSFGTLCGGCKVDIMSLDVVSISLNWPPKLEDP